MKKLRDFGGASKAKDEEKDCGICENDDAFKKFEMDPLKKSKVLEKPPDKSVLGRASWTLLHIMAANYPETPSLEDQQRTREFLHLFSELYPVNQQQMAQQPKEQGLVEKLVDEEQEESEEGVRFVLNPELAKRFAENDAKREESEFHFPILLLFPHQK